MYAIADFAAQVKLVALIHHANPNAPTELNTVATALSTDPTFYDLTLQTPPAALLPGPSQTKFTNDVLLIVNKGKGGALTPTAMSSAITSGLANILAPVNTVAPVVTGTGTVGQTLSCTTGTWLYTPSSYQYQWMRGGVPIIGATANTYVSVVADSGNNVSCSLTAVNAAGASNSVSSNSIAVA
jgi:hypothetical protein